MQTIGSFNLKNDAGFDCATGCNYFDYIGGGVTSGSQGGVIQLGQSESYNPGDHGVPGPVGPVPQPVQLRIKVYGGDDRTGAPYFAFDPASSVCAYYKITGTTLNSTVTLVQVE